MAGEVTWRVPSLALEDEAIHLTHVYTKLGLTSRVQLAQEAARHI